MKTKIYLFILTLLLSVGNAWAYANPTIELCGVLFSAGNQEDIAPKLRQALGDQAEIEGEIFLAGYIGMIDNKESCDLTFKNVKMKVNMNQNYGSFLNVYLNNNYASNNEITIFLEGNNVIEVTSNFNGNAWGFRPTISFLGSGNLTAKFHHNDSSNDVKPLTIVKSTNGFTGWAEFTHDTNGTIANQVNTSNNYMTIAHNTPGLAESEYINHVLPGHTADYVDSKVLRIMPVKKYNLYVAGKQVDWTNMNDITDDHNSVRYNRANNKLIFTNAKVNYHSAFYSFVRFLNGSDSNTENLDNSSIAVQLNGTNELSLSPNLNGNTFAAFEPRTVFSGDGSMTINVNNPKGPAYGFYDDVTLTENFEGWISVSASSGNNSAAAAGSADLFIPNTLYYFVAKGNSMPLQGVELTTHTQVSINTHQCARFGRIANNYTLPKLEFTNNARKLELEKTAYVGKQLKVTNLTPTLSYGAAPFYYTVSNLPAGLSIDSSTGQISGTYTTVDAGGTDVVITVTDMYGNSASTSYTKPKVVEQMIFANDGSVNLPDNQMVRGVEISSINLAQDNYLKNYQTPLTWSAEGLPAGVTVDANGLLKGAPTAVKSTTSKATITVTDADEQTASIEINVGRVFENYEFNVAGTLVTGINKDGIVVPGNKTSGTISYDPETETLTFDNVRINNTAASTSYFVDSKISKINVVGDNRITYTGSSISGVSKYYGFPGNLDIYGDGKFSFRSGRTGPDSYAVNGNVTIMNDATILLSSYYAAVNGTLTVPMNQAIYTANSTGVSVSEWTSKSGVAENVSNYTNKYVKTEKLPEGALRFTEDFHLPEFLYSIKMTFNLADYVAGGVAPYTISAEGLPKGIIIKDGVISGAPDDQRIDAINDIVIKVTDDMDRSITKTMHPTVTHPDFNYHIYGGNEAEVSGTVHDWWYIENMTLGANRLMYVDFPWDTNDDLPDNVIALDADGKWWARDIELTDGVPYAAPYEVNAEYIYYTRTFGKANAWQALCIPFSINVEDYLGQFDIAELFAFCPLEDTNGNGDVDAYDDNMLIVAPMKTGKTVPNVPYVIRPKEAKTYTITAEQCQLADCVEGQVTFSTSHKNFKVAGILSESVVADAENGYYYMVADGSLSHRTSGTTTIKPNRWYLEISGRSYGGFEENISADGPSLIRVRAIGEDLDEETAIRMIEEDSTSVHLYDGIYSINGMRVNENGSLRPGFYIKNNQKILVK